MCMPNPLNKLAIIMLSSLLLNACASAANDPSNNPSNSTPNNSTPTMLASTERLSVQVPDRWVVALENKLGQLAITEWVPAGTTSTWTEKLTLEALGGTPLPDPLDFVQGLAEEQSAACINFADSNIYAGFENGYQTTVHLFECGASRVTNAPLVTMVKAIRGNDAFYTITRIWRLQSVPGKTSARTPIDPAQIAAWSASLKDMTLCDAALAAHACASAPEG